MYDPLEEKARYYAKKAVLADKNGVYDEAIKYYKEAIKLFTMLVKLRQESPYTRIYMDLIKEYSERVKVLESQAEKVSAGRRTHGSDEFDLKIYKVGDPRRPKTTFNDVVGLDDVKIALLKSVVYPIRRPEFFPLGWPRGILLYGPPGCGKTYIAGALANEAGAVLIKVSPADIMSKWLGEAEKNVAKLFNIARNMATKGIPVIIFIDEVDGLLRVYSDEIGGEARVKNQFLMEMEGLEDSTLKIPLFVIGTTNKPWILEQGFIRRFQKRIYVPPPNRETRKMLFKYYIDRAVKGVFRLAADVDIDILADLTEGYSSSDIKNIVMETINDIVAEHFERTGGTGEGTPREITLEDFKRVIKRIKPSISPEIVKAYIEWSRKFSSI